MWLIKAGKYNYLLTEPHPLTICQQQYQPAILHTVALDLPEQIKKDIIDRLISAVHLSGK
jgi:hypothetical protein